MVSIGIDEESRVVVGAVIGAGAGRTIVPAASTDTVTMEGINRLLRCGGKSDVEAVTRQGGIVGEVEQQQVLVVDQAIADGFIAIEDAAVAQCAEGGVVEATGTGEVAYAQRKMMEHRTPQWGTDGEHSGVSASALRGIQRWRHLFPPHFIEKLEQWLEVMEAERSRPCDVVVPLRPATGTLQRASHAAVPTQDESTAVPVSTLRALSNILDILHTAHLLQQDQITASMVSEQSVECLIVCGRDLLKGLAGAMWTNA